MRKNTTKIRMIILLILLKIVYEVIYTNYIGVIFSYSGFKLEGTTYSYIISWLLYILFIPIVLKTYFGSLFSDTVISIFFLVSYMPTLVLYANMPGDYIYGFSLFFFMMFIYIRLIPFFRFKRVRIYLSRRGIITVSIILITYIIFIWAFYAKFHIQTSLIDVYKIRSASTNYNMPIILLYLLSMMQAAILPALGVWALSNNNWQLFVLYTSAQFISFCINGLKSTVFAYIFAVFGYLLIVKFSNAIKYLAHTCIGIGIIGYIEFLVMKHSFILYYFIRRVFYVPALLTKCYYDYFSSHEFDYYRQGILKLFGVESPYSMSISHIIGGEYFNNYGMGANNGLFADAYANLGIAGILIVPLLLVFILKLLDASSKELPTSILFASIITTSYRLMGSFLFTSILTHGILALIILYYFMPRTACVRTLGRRKQS